MDAKPPAQKKHSKLSPMKKGQLDYRLPFFPHDTPVFFCEPMRKTLVVLSRIAAALFFVLLFGLALKNAHEATFFFYFGYKLQGPLVLLLLIFFAAGSVLSILCMTPMILRDKRELLRKRKLIETLEKSAEKAIR